MLVSVDLNLCVYSNLFYWSVADLQCVYMSALQQSDSDLVKTHI